MHPCYPVFLIFIPHVRVVRLYLFVVGGESRSFLECVLAPSLPGGAPDAKNFFWVKLALVPEAPVSRLREEALKEHVLSRPPASSCHGGDARVFLLSSAKAIGKID